MRWFAIILMLSGTALAQAPTPEPTPTPRVTPTPEPVRPARYTEDRAAGDKGPVVTADRAPEDYRMNRDRGTLLYSADVRNYSFHRVVLPPTRPLVIEGANFTQSLASTVVFWELLAQGNGGEFGVTGDLLKPDRHAVSTADRGCYLRVAPGPGRRGRYRVIGQLAGAWRLNESAGPALTKDVRWRLICPVRDFEGITFRECNLRNVWLPTALGPKKQTSNTSQGDLAPEPTPEPTP